MFLTTGLVLSGLAICLCSAPAQVPGRDFSQDPCGNPLMESQLWVGVEGNVARVVNANTVEIEIADPPRTVRVRLAAIQPARGGRLSGEAKELLQKRLLNQRVEFLVVPGVWIDRQPRKVTGVLRVPGDIEIALLAGGLVGFKRPPPYTVPRYRTCQYRRAEAEARSGRLGLWK